MIPARWIRPLAVCSLAALACAVVVVRAQDPAQAPKQPVFRAGTMLVPIDVRVLDAQGRPVTDLTAADFTVLEDRRPQKVAHFWTQGLAPAPSVEPLAALQRSQETRTVGPQTRRIFLIVLGRGRLQPPAKGVDGVIHLVRNRLMPQDYVAVAGWNRATDFTTDHASIAAVLERFKTSHEGIESKLRQQFSGLAAVYGTTRINPSIQKDIDAVFSGPGVPVRTIEAATIADQDRIARDTRQATDALQRGELLAARPAGSTLPDAVDPIEALGLGGMTFDEYIETNAQSMQDLSRLYSGINYLRQIDGEKHLLFLSEHGILLPRAEDDRSVAALASDARVVIDIIHTGGVPLQMAARGARGGAGASPIRSDPASLWKVATARTVTEQTGGRFAGNVMAATAIDRIDTATRFQYVLGYYTANPALDGRYRRIVVRVNRPGLTVLYRHGYFARAEPPPLERRQVLTQTRIAAAGNYVGDVPDIRVQAKASPVTTPEGMLEMAVDVVIDASRLSLPQVDGRYVGAIDITVFCGDARENLVGQTWQRMDFKLLDDLRARFLREGVPYTARVPVRAPVSFVKVVVYDYAADLLGSATVRLKPPR
jgi:VWFA-related protein